MGRSLPWLNESKDRAKPFERPDRSRLKQCLPCKRNFSKPATKGAAPGLIAKSEVEPWTAPFGRGLVPICDAANANARGRRTLRVG